MTSAFGPDSEGNHQLEGLVTGLPLGPSTLAASTHKQAKGNKHYDEVTLTNNPLQGPIFSGPHQTPFVCATASNAAGMGLPPIPQSPTCETPTVVSFVYRSTAAGNPYLDVRPGRAAVAVVDRDDDDDGRQDGADDPALGARRDQPLHVLDPDALAADRRRRRPTSRPGTGRRSGASPAASRSATRREPLRAATCAISPACGWGTPSSTRAATARTRTTTSSSAARRRSWSRTASSRRTRSRSTRSRSAAPAARSSSTSTARTTPACSTAGCRSTRTRTWSRRRSTSATASCSSAGSTRRCSRTRSRCGGRGSTGR